MRAIKKAIIKGISLLLTLVLGSVMFACQTKKPSTVVEGDTTMKNYPYYTDPSKASYDNFKFSATKDGVTQMSEEVYRPYWYGNVIYNETVLLVKNDETDEISGNLLYAPLKVLAAKNHDYTQTFLESEDFTISGNKIVRTQNSKIKYHTKAELRGEDIKLPYLLKTSLSDVSTDIVKMGATIYTESDFLYGYQVSVSYVYNPKDATQSYPMFDKAFAPKFIDKLSKKQETNMTIIGDSVAEGCSSSAYFNHTPYMPNYITMVKAALEKTYDTTINLFNKAKGGEASGWGANDAQINAVAATNPDIVFIHFGINDCGAEISQNMYYDNMQRIGVELKAKCPQTEVIFLKCFTPEPVTYDSDRLNKYAAKIDEVCADDKDFYSIDLFKLSTEMLKVKSYMDVTANGINHINDYTARLYTMSILSKLVDYKSLANKNI